jgi:hypothetical protein
MHPVVQLVQALAKHIEHPAYLSLGVAGRDTSWHGLLMHQKQNASAPGASKELVDDVETITRLWTAIRHRFRRRGVRMQRQLLLGPSLG